jgi:hypothetical protein
MFNQNLNKSFTNYQMNLNNEAYFSFLSLFPFFDNHHGDTHSFYADLLFTAAG